MRVERGETMVLVRFGAEIDEALNQRAVNLAARVRRRDVPGVRDVVPAYCTVGIHFDPLATDLRQLEDVLEAEATAEAGPEARIDDGAAAASLPVAEIPVRYGGDDGPDLADVALWAGCTIEDVIARHHAREYRVFMLGFVPGFAYLGTVDERIAAPRRATPRERVPAGSVGIAGRQTGVYPMATPGGWQIIGRTDARMFDVARTPRNLLAAGQRVRFVPAAGGRP